MNKMDMNDSNIENGIPQRAISLYGQGEGVDDFPVLKAFQQYIDAEQEKARKRIIGLGIFFGSILIVVIAVFLFLLYGINARNQSLSDRLVEYAMKEADRRQQVLFPAPKDDTVLKAVADTLAALQRNIETSGNATVRQRFAENNDREDVARLQRAKNQLESEKKLLAKERERLRLIEIEQQRRILYPELYEDHGRRTSSSSRQVRSLTDEDIREIIREAYPDAYLKRPDIPIERSSKRKADDAPDVEKAEESDDAIEYYKDDDFTIPVDVKGSSTKVRFTVPIDG